MDNKIIIYDISGNIIDETSVANGTTYYLYPDIVEENSIFNKWLINNQETTLLIKEINGKNCYSYTCRCGDTVTAVIGKEYKIIYYNICPNENGVQSIQFIDKGYVINDKAVIKNPNDIGYETCDDCHFVGTLDGNSQYTDGVQDYKYGNIIDIDSSFGSELKLYPKWYSDVTLYPNGGDGNIIHNSVLLDKQFPLQSAEYYGFSYPHHSFMHWNTKSDNSGTKYSEGEYSLQCVSLQAIWKEDNRFKIQYNRCDGTQYSQDINEGYGYYQGITVPTITYTPNDSSLIFENWQYGSAQYAEMQSITSYNQGWIKLNANCRSVGPYYIQYINYDRTAQVVNSPYYDGNTASIQSYNNLGFTLYNTATFLNWYDNNNNYYSGQYITIHDDKTLYANCDTGHGIQYINCDETQQFMTSPSALNSNILVNREKSITSYYPQFKSEGCNFIGWAASPNGDIIYSDYNLQTNVVSLQLTNPLPNGLQYNSIGNVELYAVCDCSNYTMTYIPCESMTQQANIYTQEISSSDTYYSHFPTQNETAQNMQYILDDTCYLQGWSFSNLPSAQIITNGFQVTNDVTLFAVCGCQSIEQFTLTYYPCESMQTSQYSKTINYNTLQNIAPSAQSIANISGDASWNCSQCLQGWNVQDNNGGSQYYTPTDTMQNITKDLYIQSVCNPSITYYPCSTFQTTTPYTNFVQKGTLQSIAPKVEEVKEWSGDNGWDCSTCLQQWYVQYANGYSQYYNVIGTMQAINENVTVQAICQ